MYLLYTSITIGLTYSFYKLCKYLFFPKLKSFDDNFSSDDEDDYMFLSYTIKYFDGSKTEISEELSQEEIEELDSENKIKYIIINYLYNDKLMKYITYSLDIEFPIYETKAFSSNCEIIESVYLNEKDVTSYVKPFLGPKNNFYIDKNIKINMRDMFEDYPELENLDFLEGTIEIVSSSGKKLFYDLPWTPMWKKFSGLLDQTTEINFEVENNKSSSIYGFTIVDEKIFNK